MPHFFVLYDSRAAGGDTDEAAVLVSACTEKSARKDNASFRGQAAVWFEYDILPGGQLVNERRRADLDPE
jgi:hypothetical protein